MDGIAAFYWGVFGGIGAELLQWYRIRDRLNSRAQNAKALYWVLTILMVLFGGGLAYMYVASGTTLTPILAFNVGLTAPLAMAAGSKNVPEIGLNTS